MKILSIASNEASSALLKRTLTAQHHVVDVVTDGELGWTYAATFEYDAIVLEISLPKLDGITLCKRLRGEGYLLPIMFLTVQDSIDAKVQGLDAGADDYLVQPCNPNELMARLRALLRRSNNPIAPTLSWGDLTIDPCSCAVSYDGRPIELTTKEYDLLELFVRNSYQVFSSDEIIDRLWSSNDFPTAATVRSHLRRLRHKLAAAGAPPDAIGTIHGRGYYLKPLGTDPPFALTNTARESSPLLAETTLAASEWREQARLLCVAIDPQMLLAIGNLSVTPITFASIATAEAYIATLADTPLDRLVATVVVVNLDSDPTAIHTLEFLRHVKQRFPQWSVLILSDTNRWQQRLAIVRERGKFLCYAGLSSDRLGAAINSLLQPSATHIKVMVVDNDLDWLRGLPKLLQHWHLKVTTLADPQQFWLVLESVRPDVLILEFTLAETNGLDLCQVVRNDPLWQHLPILFLSSTTDLLSQQAAFSVGADDYLCKPIAGGELAGRIRNRLARFPH